MDVKKEILKLRWRKWLERYFNPFYFSLFTDGNKEEYYSKLGMPGVESRAIFAQGLQWYQSDEIFDEMANQFKRLFEKKTVFDLSEDLVNLYNASKPRMEKLVSERDATKAIAGCYEILTCLTTWIFATHAIERYYEWRIRDEVPRYFKGDVQKFVMEVSVPTKKNRSTQIVDAIKAGKDYKAVAAEFAWIPVRDFYSKPLSEADVAEYAKHIKDDKNVEIEIPPQLRQLVDELREIVWQRTERTDYFYEMLYMARPILRNVAEHFGIKYEDLEHYPIQSLIAGKPEWHKLDSTYACYKGEAVFTDELWLKEEIEAMKDEVRGIVACRGIVKGTAKIVKWTNELDKVKSGDILITQMTFPSFITAMQKAAAFVTDEGGITCHAAIVAREMQKPCIIATGNGTKVFKDGDLVEVDADNGVVKKI